MRARLLATAATAAGILLGGVALAPTAAQAATYTSTGLRCTKAGTAGADHITGTAGADVICGLGGNDVINGGGGNDVIDGGAGADVVHGNDGNDRLYGGYGNDRLYGDNGADGINGQFDNDTLLGGYGNDIISGLAGADRVDAGPDNDVVDGGTGNDVIQGGTGNDRLSGSYDNDVVSGSSGTDAVNGNSGNDDLSGGTGADTLNGGTGTNWCEISSADIRYACKVDTTPAAVTGLSLNATSVNVSYGAKAVVAKVHVTDDTGARSVQVGAQYEDGTAYADGGMATLSSGTVRDGWWSVTLRVPQYITSGRMTVNVFVNDRVGRASSRDFPEVLSVTSTRADLQPPVVRSAAVSPTSVDVRTAGKTVTAKVRITDDIAGVGTAYLCPAHLFADAFRQAGGCDTMQRVSGTNLDGYWTGSFTVPQGSVGGTWNIQVWVEDASSRHGMQYYAGPDQLAWERAAYGAPQTLALPGGAGRFAVVGTSDNHAPLLERVTVSPATVRSMDGPQTVYLDVAVTDVEGVTGVGASLRTSEESGGAGPDVGQGRLVSGTARDGVWRVPLQFVQGASLGTYYTQLWVEDSTHWLSWVSPGSLYEGSGLPTLTSDQAPGGATVVVVE